MGKGRTPAHHRACYRINADGKEIRREASIQDANHFVDKQKTKLGLAGKRINIFYLPHYDDPLEVADYICP